MWRLCGSKKTGMMMPMIGRLTGKILDKQPPHLLVDVQGVGYEVAAPMSTFYRLPATGETVSLFTHLIVREDAQLLYGFSSEQERRLFRTLIKINGVGPKLAVTILSGIEAEAFVQCVVNQDSATLVRLPGVGKKTADRLIIEMKDRLGDWVDTNLSITGFSFDSHLTSLVPSALNDAISALISLGYKPQEASKAVQRIQDDSLTSEELIRQALRQVA